MNWRASKSTYAKARIYGHTGYKACISSGPFINWIIGIFGIYYTRYDRLTCCHPHQDPRLSGHRRCEEGRLGLAGAENGPQVLRRRRLRAPRPTGGRFSTRLQSLETIFKHFK